MEARTADACVRVSKPLTQARPALGSSSVVSRRIRVLLPAPLLPNSPNKMPRGTCKLTPRNASTRRFSLVYVLPKARVSIACT